jgi:predicted NUDIX family phosphoesterase
MIEALEDEKLDVLILDRGLFDGLVWIDWQQDSHRLSVGEADTFRRFILTPRWRDLVDLVFVMHCDPTDSIDREHAKQITLRRGSIMNTATLAQLQRHYLRAVRRYKPEFQILKVLDSSRGKEMQLIAQVGQFVLDILERFSDEQVLCVPRKALEAQVKLSPKRLITPNWRSLVRLVNREGAYISRSEAEKSDDWMQVVPVCVIRHGNNYLTNVRHEPGESLHDALGNWAGGHVRKQDLKRGHSKWESVTAGLKREIHEELSLEELPKPQEVGIVHSTEDPRAARHLGIVFQVKFSDSSTASMLQHRTIRERPNRYVRTAWTSKAELSRTLTKQRDWSRAISDFIVTRRTA